MLLNYNNLSYYATPYSYTRKTLDSIDPWLMILETQLENDLGHVLQNFLRP
jgi:hypothetical protein